MDASKRRRPPQPLDQNRLEEMAIRYVGRFATSRKKLADYLHRKLTERGWQGARDPDVGGLVERLSGLGYVDDQAFALSKARSLAARGYGERRLQADLYRAGIEEKDSVTARRESEAGSVESALRFAKRKRLGPFAAEKPDPRQLEKALAAMVRAGHNFSLSKAIIALDPGQSYDADSLEI